MQCLYRNDELVEDISTYYTGIYIGERTPYSIVLGMLPRMGTVDSAVLSSNIIRTWSPSCLLLLGIAAGFKQNGVLLGDVIVSNEIIYYEPAKLTDTGVNIRFQHLNVDPLLLDRAMNFSKVDWHKLISVPRPSNNAESSNLEIYYKNKH